MTITDVPEPGGEAWFRPAVVVVFLVAVAARVGFVLFLAAPGLAADPFFYRDAAQHIADGQGFSWGTPGHPFFYIGHPSTPFADHPPAFPIVLAGLDRLGMTTARGQGIGLAVVASLGVVIMAILGRKLHGALVGIVAAAIAALHPLWIQPSGIVMSESIFLVLVPAVLLVAFQLLDRPSWGGAFRLGLVIGVATLTRPEALGFAFVLGVPTVLLATRRWVPRVGWYAVVLAGCLLLVGPWVVRNHVEFGGFAISTQQGAAFSATNCPATYAGPGIGGFDVKCLGNTIIAALMGPLYAEAKAPNPVHLSTELQSLGLQYIRDNKGRLPAVVAARLLRGWGLWYFDNQLAYDVIAEGRHRGMQRAGQYVNWALLALAVAGAVLLPRRSWRRWSVVLAGPALFIITSITIYGSVRLRTMAEPSIALLAAFTLVAAARRLTSRGGRPGTDADVSVPLGKDTLTVDQAPITQKSRARPARPGLDGGAKGASVRSSGSVG